MRTEDEKSLQNNTSNLLLDNLVAFLEEMQQQADKVLRLDVRKAKVIDDCAEEVVANWWEVSLLISSSIIRLVHLRSVFKFVIRFNMSLPEWQLEMVAKVMWVYVLTALVPT